MTEPKKYYKIDGYGDRKERLADIYTPGGRLLVEEMSRPDAETIVNELNMLLDGVISLSGAHADKEDAKSNTGTGSCSDSTASIQPEHAETLQEVIARARERNAANIVKTIDNAMPDDDLFLLIAPSFAEYMTIEHWRHLATICPNTNLKKAVTDMLSHSAVYGHSCLARNPTYDGTVDASRSASQHDSQ